MRTFIIFTQMKKEENTITEPHSIFPNIVEATNVSEAVGLVINARPNHRAIAASFPSLIKQPLGVEGFTAVAELIPPVAPGYAIGPYKRFE